MESLSPVFGYRSKAIKNNEKIEHENGLKLGLPFKEWTKIWTLVKNIFKCRLLKNSTANS